MVHGDLKPLGCSLLVVRRKASKSKAPATFYGRLSLMRQCWSYFDDIIPAIIWTCRVFMLVMLNIR